MNLERLHGVNFSTPLAGVGLEAAPHAEAPSFAIEVRSAAELPWSLDVPLVARWSRPGDACELEVRGVGRFAIAAERIEVTPVPSLREDVLRLFLRYHAVGLRMRVAGFVVLHGAAVSLGGQAHVWVGVSGAGKTGSALEACGRGARFLADEVVVLRVEGDRFFVRRGVPWPRVEAGAPMHLHRLAHESLAEGAEEVPLGRVLLPRSAGRPGEAAQLAAQVIGGYRPELTPLPDELRAREALLDALVALRS
jgi:hypothetical protein